MKRAVLTLVAVIALAWMAAPAMAHPPRGHSHGFRHHYGHRHIHPHHRHFHSHYRHFHRPVYGVYGAPIYHAPPVYYAPAPGFFYHRPGLSVGFGW